MLLSAFVFPSVGWLVWTAAPLMGASVIGYRCRAKPWVTWLFRGLFGVGIIVGLMSAGLAGVFIGLILATILFVPIAFGIFLGFMLRETLKVHGFSQAPYLPILAIAGVGLACAIASWPGAIWLHRGRPVGTPLAWNISIAEGS
jgi:hypothetical protein